MCVASGECSTSTGSNPKDPTRSKIRSPPPSRPDTVLPHEAAAPGPDGPAASAPAGLVGALVAEVPAVQLPAALPKRGLATLVRPGDEAVERDRHVAGGVRHRDSSEGVDD